MCEHCEWDEKSIALLMGLADGTIEPVLVSRGLAQQILDDLLRPSPWSAFLEKVDKG
jgi:hypothetical protein